MASVSQLGYLGIGTSNAKAWQDLATTILGLQVVPGDDTSTSYLRMDEYHHRLELRSTGSDDLEFVGWEVPDPATLQRVAQQLEDGGVRVTPGTRDEADNRRVIDLVKCVDPDGIPTEVFCGRPINPQPFHPARPISGFKTGDMGLGHILVYARSLHDTVHFYRDLLGFRVSDFTEVRTPGGTVRLAFLHCNPATTPSPSWRPPARPSASTTSCSSATPSTTSAPAATSACGAGSPSPLTSAAT
jgi:2,3-dihydroxybiphenyl 1,2-dioxygenase